MEIIIEELKTLHNEFVVGPIDKASSHVALFCQGHYTQVTSMKYLEVTSMNKKLTNIYSTRKLQKNTTRASFIIASPKC